MNGTNEATVLTDDPVGGGRQPIRRRFTVGGAAAVTGTKTVTGSVPVRAAPSPTRSCSPTPGRRTQGDNPGNELVDVLPSEART